MYYYAFKRMNRISVGLSITNIQHLKYAEPGLIKKYKYFETIFRFTNLNRVNNINYIRTDRNQLNRSSLLLFQK